MWTTLDAECISLWKAACGRAVAKPKLGSFCAPAPFLPYSFFLANDAPGGGRSGQSQRRYLANKVSSRIALCHDPHSLNRLCPG